MEYTKCFCGATIESCGNGWTHSHMHDNRFDHAASPVKLPEPTPPGRRGDGILSINVEQLRKDGILVETVMGCRHIVGLALCSYPQLGEQDHLVHTLEELGSEEPFKFCPLCGIRLDVELATLSRPEPTPPTETQAIKVTRRSLSDPDEVAALLDEIHKDVQDQIHDQWDWMNASFYTECLRCMVHRAREVAAPTERVDDVIARMIQEVAPAPLCVSETAVRQLRPLLEELAKRRGAERVETSRDDLAAAIELLKRTIPFTQCDSDCDCEGDRLYQETLAFIDKVAAVAPSPAGESQHVHTYECLDASGKCRITGEV